MVSAGYQRDDEQIIDYKMWTLPGSDFLVRGPMVDVSAGKYFAAIGAAQTFGRFVERPYVKMLGERLGVPGLNLGVSGAGPTFFTDRPELMRRLTRSRFVIVQMMSGRSVSNSRFTVQQNQGLVKPAAGGAGKPQFAQDAYTAFLEKASHEEAVSLKAEIRVRYIEEMKLLLKRIPVPKILLYWSTRPADYAEALTPLDSYWGGFPHFVNEEVISALEPYADRTVRVVTSRGIPQPLFNRFTGEPVKMWPEDLFPNLELRHHNHYYPSPEMHEDVANQLIGAARELAPSPRAAPERRKVLVHMHVFKNAGSTVDAQLSRQLGDRFMTYDPPHFQDIVSSEELLAKAEENPAVEAIASHQLRFPIEGTNRVQLYPFLFLRHPIDRAESIYAFERREDRQAEFSSPHTKAAHDLSFSDFVEWCLSVPRSSVPIGNFQTRMCSLRHNGRTFEDWDMLPNLTNLAEALEHLSQLRFVGLVDEFDQSVKSFEMSFFHLFNGLRLQNERENVSRKVDVPLAERIGKIRDKLGQSTFDKLLAANEHDLVLYDYARRRLGLA